MYDLIVLGGGPAGYLAAERAAHAGMKVCLFEKKSAGRRLFERRMRSFQGASQFREDF